MDLEVSFIKSILTLYNELVDNGISLVYLGEFSHEITKMFTAMADKDMSRQNEEKSTHKVVYHTMVETLQNMNKHSDEIADKSNVGKGLFMIGHKEDTYYIITSNKVTKDRIDDLKHAIEEVNSATPEELKVMYKTQLRHGKLSPKGGAGLGLIDIARKTKTKLGFQFLPLDDDTYFFILRIKIDPQLLNKEKIKEKRLSV